MKKNLSHFVLIPGVTVLVIVLLSMLSLFTFFPVESKAETIIPVGSPMLGSSWSVKWGATGLGFNKIESFIILIGGDPVEFEPPGADSFQTPDSIPVPVEGWSAAIINSKYLLMQGPETGDFRFYLHFTGEKANQHFYLDGFVYLTDGTISLGHGDRFEWNGISWKFIGSIDYDPNIHNRAPEPTPKQEIADIQNFFDNAVSGETLAGIGPTPLAAKGKLGALRNMLEQAEYFIDNGLFPEACQQLLDVYKKTDGNPKPEDFVMGEAAPELAEMISNLITDLECP